MIGLIRALVPKWDRRSEDRFRDTGVRTALESTERVLESNRTLQSELRAIDVALGSTLRKAPPDARRSSFE